MDNYFIWKLYHQAKYYGEMIRSHESRIRKLGEKNPDKVVYIVRRSEENVGLMSYYVTTLGHIKYAIDKGYIPVVDMMSQKNTYISNEEIGKVNSWDYYFNQPSEIELKEALSSEQVIFSTALKSWPCDKMGLYQSRNDLGEWRKYARRYCWVKEEIIDTVSMEYKKMFPNNEAVLGIKIRGTDYVKLKPKGHPVQPTIDMVIKQTRIMLKRNACKKIFLATEDIEAIEAMKEAFGEAVYMLKQELYQYKGNVYFSEMHSIRSKDEYYKGYEYLMTLLMLSKCNYFLASRNSGTTGVLLFSDGFKDMFIWNLGVY